MLNDRCCPLQAVQDAVGYSTTLQEYDWTAFDHAIDIGGYSSSPESCFLLAAPTPSGPLHHFQACKSVDIMPVCRWSLWVFSCCLDEDSSQNERDSVRSATGYIRLPSSDLRKFKLSNALLPCLSKVTAGTAVLLKTLSQWKPTHPTLVDLLVAKRLSATSDVDLFT